MLEMILEVFRWEQVCQTIDGFLTEYEGQALLLLAACGESDAEIVEIGSFLGRSTAFLAAGARIAHRGKVTAIDHFAGGREHQAGQAFASKDLLRDGSTLPQFSANLLRVGLLGNVSVLVGKSHDLSEAWEKPINLLFIDGDHEYDSVRDDFNSWSKFVCRGGIVCFHDFGGWAGVTQFYNELTATTKEYKEIAHVHSMKVIQKG